MSSPGSLPRRLRFVSPVLALALMLVVTPVARGQETALNWVFPSVSRDHYDSMCTHLGIDREQRAITELLYRDYMTGLDELVDRLDRAAVAAGRSRVEEVFAGRVNMAGETLRSLRLEVLNCYRDAAPESARLFENLIAGLESQLFDEQRAAFPAALRALRRQVFMHPRHSTRALFTYAGEGVDLLQLVDVASHDGNELAELDLVAIGDILDRYEILLDSALIEIGITPEQATLGLRLRILDKNDAAIARHHNELIDAWTAIYRVNRQAVDAISDLAERTEGEWASELWLDRYDRASFGWMYLERMPGRQIAWIRGKDLDPATHEAAELTFGLYLAERSALVREAITLITRGRLEERTILSPYKKPADASANALAMYQELLRNSGEQTSLETRIIGELEALLDDENRADMRRAVRGRRR